MGKFVVFILIVCVITALADETTSPSASQAEQFFDRFSITVKQLEESCEKRNATFWQNVLSRLETLLSFQENATREYLRKTKHVPIDGNMESFQFMNEYCEANQAIHEAVKTSMDAVQLCLEEKDHVTGGIKDNIFFNTIQAICYTLELERLISSQKDCIQDPRKLPSKDECAVQYKKFEELYHLYPIPLVRTQEECNALSNVWNCIQTNKACDDSIQQELKKSLDVMKSLIFFC